MSLLVWVKGKNVFCLGYWPHFQLLVKPFWASLVAHSKESACNAGDLGSIPAMGRSPGEGNGHSFQDSCLENSMGRGAWQATVHGVARSRTWLSNFTQHPKNISFSLTGDWNATVRSQEIPGVTGKFGLGVKNKAGQRLTEFCQENALVIANTLFQQNKRRRYTWTSPDGQYQNQIDYILCSQRWRSSIQSAKIRSGADCGLNSLLPN